MKKGSDYTPQPVIRSQASQPTKPDRMAMNLKSTRVIYKALEIEQPDPDPQKEYRDKAKAISTLQRDMAPLTPKQAKRHKKSNASAIEDFQRDLKPIEARK